MSGIIALTSCVVDLRRHQILRNGVEIGLTPLEAGLLEALAQSPGETVTRDELLHRVWGYREGVVTRAVDKTVARLRAKLDIDPQSPVHLLNVRGVGYRLDGIVAPPLTAEPREHSSPAPIADSAHARSPRREHTNLEDWDVRTFVGRAEEGRLRELMARDARLVSLLGPGGSGKTRLARRVGGDLTAAFPGGVWFVDLTEVRSAEGLLAAVGCTLGAPVSVNDSDQGVENAILSRGRTLLILDNAEQIASHVASLLARWTRTLRDVRFLVTTRERLRIGGESCLELEPLSEDEAMALFLERAHEAGVQVDPNQREPLLQLVTLLDRMPLALELAAARVRLFGLSELASQITRDLSVLRTGRRDVSAREATLLGAIGWSWDLLSEEERCVLCQAALFASGFGLEAARAVFDTTGDATGLLEALVDKSMIRVLKDEFGRPRFRLYESIRAFASSHGAQRRRRAPLLLARFFAEEVERLAQAILARHGDVAFRMMLLERDNALAGFTTASVEAPDLAVQIALGLQQVLAATGPLALAEQVLSEAISLARAGGDRSTIAQALAARGATRGNLAMLDLAREDLEAALASVPLEALVLAAHIRSELGHICRLQARTADAFVHYEAALATTPTSGFAPAVLHSRIGRLCANVGRLDEADRHLAAALALAQAIGNARLEAEILLDLGWVAEARLDFVLAIDLDEEALGLATLSGDRRAQAKARLAIGTVQMESTSFIEAIATLDEACRALASVGDRRAHAIARCHLGICLLATGDAPGAICAIEEAITLLAGVGDEVNVGVIETNLAEAHHLSGDLDRARDVLERAVARLRKGGVQALLGSALAHLAAVEADRGDLERARLLFDEAALSFSQHPKPGEQGTFAIRRMHLTLAAALAQAPDRRDDSALASVRAALHAEPGEPAFAMLARRQLAGALDRSGRR